MHESRGQFGHPGRSVAWYVRGYEWGLSNHSIVLSTRKVIVRSWTGLRMDMEGGSKESEGANSGMGDIRWLLGCSGFTRRVRRTLCHHLSLDWTSLWKARWPVSLSQSNLGLPVQISRFLACLTLDERALSCSLAR